MRARAAWLGLAAGGVALGACQALPPAVSTALVGFGQDVLAAAAQNFTPEYSASMQSLFLAMAETATGMPFTEEAVDSEAPDQYEEDPYGTEAYVDEDPYAQEAYAPDSYSATGPAPAASYAAPPGIALEVALLAQQRDPDGEVRLRPVRDGDVLHDGRGDPSSGDKIKILFNANCACHVYVIGIDATGYVAQIFPERGAGPSRVQPGAEYLVPAGTTWWGLDDHRGVEQVYFIASHERREDIENLVARLAGQRPDVPPAYRPVREPAIVPMQRGLVQVQSAAPTSVSTQTGTSQQVSPTLFQSTVADADLVITRWFRHE